MNGNIEVRIINNLAEAEREIGFIGADQVGCRIMAPKAVHRVLKISQVNLKQAHILKQEMLARGGEAATARGVIDASIEQTDILLIGTLQQFDSLIKKLKQQPFGLAAMADQIKGVLDHLEGRRVLKLACRGKKITLGQRTLVMGILNVTPDSFSDGGRFNQVEAALDRAWQMVADGVDIIDLGGESTHPGYIPVSPEEELARVIPALEHLVKEIPVPISVDTTKAAVARAALAAGAHMINDQWALQADPEMATVAAEYLAPVILMHNQTGTVYRDLMGDMVAFLRKSMEIGSAAGIPEQNFIVDPGVGFGKTYEQNLQTMGRLRELAVLGKPVLIGTSRKSLIAKTLDLPPDQRVEGTGATVALGIVNGADIVRVHDVKEMVRVAKMTDAMLGRGVINE